MVISSPRASASSFRAAPIDWDDEAEHRRKLAEAINLAIRGKLNAVTTATLTISSATTTVSDERIGANTAVLLIPTTANASAEFGNGTIYVTYPNATEGQAVINHANNAQADRTFVVVLIG